VAQCAMCQVDLDGWHETDCPALSPSSSAPEGKGGEVDESELAEAATRLRDSLRFVVQNEEMRMDVLIVLSAIDALKAQVEALQASADGQFDAGTSLTRLLDKRTKERDEARAQLRDAKRSKTLRPKDEWYEDMGPVLWWLLPIKEPPYSGTPLDEDFPDYVTHWTEIPMPVEARSEAEDG
jgi:hypothetical protein